MIVQISRYPVALLAFLFVHLVAVTVSACMCEPRKPCQAYARAETVFTGVVTQSTTEREGAPVARFRVERAYRGLDAKEVEIRGTGNSCDFYFSEGQRYLVYAYYDSNRKALYTSLCSGTSDISEAHEHLTYLNRGKTID